MLHVNASKSQGQTDALSFTSDDLTWFRAQAAQRSDRLDPELQIVLRNLEPIVSWGDGGASPRRWNPKHMIDAAATAYLLRTVRRIHERTQIPAASLWERLSAHVRQTLPTQRTERGDKFWEIVVAGVCSAHFDDVSLAEPDVTCRRAGELWGCACKAIHSPRKDTQLARIIDGMDQIEASEASRGVVIVNVTNLIPHKVFLGTFRAPVSMSVARESLQMCTRQIADRLCDAQWKERVRRWKGGRRRLKYQGVIFVAQCLAATREGIAPLMAQQSRMVLSFDHAGYRFANRFFLGWQTL